MHIILFIVITWFIVSVFLYQGQPRFMADNLPEGMLKSHNLTQSLVKTICGFPLIMISIVFLLIASFGCCILDIFAKDEWQYGLKNWKLVQFCYKKVPNPYCEYYFEPLYFYELIYK